ncbi:hypothetical protein D9M68_679780 [compost metagenome]
MRPAAAGIALDHGAQRQFRVAGGADLAHQQHVELRTERARHLKGNRHAAARQRQHQRGLSELVGAEAQFRQAAAKVMAGFAAIGKARWDWHGALPVWLAGRFPAGAPLDGAPRPI